MLVSVNCTQKDNNDRDAESDIPSSDPEKHEEKVKYWIPALLIPIMCLNSSVSTQVSQFIILCRRYTH